MAIIRKKYLIFCRAGVILGSVITQDNLLIGEVLTDLKKNVEEKQIDCVS